MKKIIITTATVIGSIIGVKAQNTQNAETTSQQTVKLQLANALDIQFVSDNSSTGSTVYLPFTNFEHYANGVESADQEIRVRSNKNFNITVKASSQHFSYTNGSTVHQVIMPVTILGISVTDNNTGGQPGQGFGPGNFKSVRRNAQTLISGGNSGNEQSFSVRYKADPGFNFPPGTYTTDIIYTATQQ